tara:strand:+ start:642 stop:749 length:108 start_codon:yes stop_codon:yes gene_type:complete
MLSATLRPIIAAATAAIIATIAVQLSCFLCPARCG